VQHLLDMPGASQRLKLFKADLLAAGAFDEAIAHCDVVIHTASPYQLDVPKGERAWCMQAVFLLNLQCHLPDFILGFKPRMYLTVGMAIHQQHALLKCCWQCATIHTIRWPTANHTSSKQCCELIMQSVHVVGILHTVCGLRHSTSGAFNVLPARHIMSCLHALVAKAGTEEELMIKPAIFGTENVLNSVNKTPTVKRVVLTASTVSVWGDPNERGKGHVFTEDDWNITATPKQFPYFYSKTKAEQRAYEMHKEAGGRWALCSLNPGAIWGPPTGSRTDGESVGQMHRPAVRCTVALGAPWASGVVDVRDVALAHCVAAVSPTASGRHPAQLGIHLYHAYSSQDAEKGVPQAVAASPEAAHYAAAVVWTHDGPAASNHKGNLSQEAIICVDKAARDLGLKEYIPVKQCVLEMAADMLAKGMVPAFKMPVAAPVILMWLIIFSAVFLGIFCLMGWVRRQTQQPHKGPLQLDGSDRLHCTCWRVV